MRSKAPQLRRLRKSKTDTDSPIPTVSPLMPTKTDKLIAALEGFKSGPSDDHALNELYEITDGFEALRDKARVIPAMFSVMERCPAADLGTPGPLVHCLESLGYEAYFTELVASVSRRPTFLTVWMVNRVLNSEVPQKHRKQLIKVLKAVVANAAASPEGVEQAKRSLEMHAAGSPSAEADQGRRV